MYCRVKNFGRVELSSGPLYAEVAQFLNIFSTFSEFYYDLLEGVFEMFILKFSHLSSTHAKIEKISKMEKTRTNLVGIRGTV